MNDLFNNIRHGDCVREMQSMPEGCVDLAFADPPFNIGYEYDVYDDAREHEDYLAWSDRWIAAVHRVLKPTGTFWLAIGDEYAAELKLASHRIGFHCRSWVIWYYTFGVNCTRKFTRSHAHLFYFVKDKAKFTFRDDLPENRVPSARELVYNDKRANPKGRLPDDTWIIRPAGMNGEMTCDDQLPAARLSGVLDKELEPPSDHNRTFVLRPQDMADRFQPTEDTWYFPRVAGTFKERAGFHGCQMPEQLLGRIIRSCSNRGDLVLDPFSGSATTLAVAKKLGRRYLGFDLSPEYVTYGRSRLAEIHVDDALDGSPEPVKSAPTTAERQARIRRGKRADSRVAACRQGTSRARHLSEPELSLTLSGVVEAFRRTHDGYSADRVVADPDLNGQFSAMCHQLGLFGDTRSWNTLLFRLRKRGKLAEIETVHRTVVPLKACDKYLSASEIALQRMLNERVALSLDEILCDPQLAAQFDATAEQLAPGFKPLDYRWAALVLRKAAKDATNRAAQLKPPKGFSEQLSLVDFRPRELPASPGLYLLTDCESNKLYVGEALNLRDRLALQFAPRQRRAWTEIAPKMRIQTLPMARPTIGTLAWQFCLVSKYRHPPLNLRLHRQRDEIHSA